MASTPKKSITINQGLRLEYTINGLLLGCLLNLNQIKLFTVQSGIINAAFLIALAIWNIPTIFTKIGNARFKTQSIYSLAIIYAVFSLFLIAIMQTLLSRSLISAFSLLEYFSILFVALIAYWSKSNDAQTLIRFSVLINFTVAIISFIDRGWLAGRYVNYLTITYPIGIGCLASLVLWVESPRRISKVFYALTYFIMTASLLNFSGRGAILFVGTLSVIYLFFPSKTISKNAYRAYFVLAGTILGSYIANLLISNQRLLARFIRLFTASEEEPRMILYQKMLLSFDQYWFTGYGLGHSGISAGMAQGVYPHNLFLEVGIELGVIGLMALFIILSCAFFIHMRQKSTQVISSFVFLAYVFGLLNYLKSFSLNQSMFLFLPLGLQYMLNKKSNVSPIKSN